MNTKNIFLTILLAVLTYTAHSQNQETKMNASVIENSIVGIITDSQTGEPLTGVQIKLEDTDYIVYTNFNGAFEINNIKPGNYTLSTYLISYQSPNQIEIKINSHNELHALNLTLSN